MKNDRLLKIVNERKIGLPRKFASKFIVNSFKKTIDKTNYQCFYHFDKEEYKNKQVIVIADHASKFVFKYTIPLYPFVRLNTMMGFQNVFRPGFRILLKAGVILKCLYEPDMKSTMELLSVIKQGGSICFFPEGIQSTSGSAQPMNPSTIKLFKRVGLDVILSKSYGAYMSTPRYTSDVKKGNIEIHYEVLFTSKELKEKTEEELYQKYLERFNYNEFEWNKTQRNKYIGKHSNAYELDNIIYRCPKCGEEFSMEIIDDTIKCKHCGNTVKVNEYYDLIIENNNICPYTSIDEWYKDQRKYVREEVKKEDFEISYEVYLKGLYFDRIRKNQEKVLGQGIVTINKQGIRYIGTKNNENVNLFYDIKEVPSYTFTPNLDNCLYYHGEYIIFKPIKDNKKVVKYLLQVEELHNLIDASWDKVSRDVYEEKTY